MTEETLFGHQNEAFEYMDERTDDIVLTESDFITPTSIPYTRYRHTCKSTIEGISNSKDEEVGEMKKLDKVIVIFFHSPRDLLIRCYDSNCNTNCH